MRMAAKGKAGRLASLAWGMALLALLAAPGCGGGGGGSTETPAPAPAPAPGTPAPAPGAVSAIAGCEMFPPAAIFNTRIDDAARFPAHANSAAWIASVGAGVRMHADWGTNDNPAQTSTYYGIPVNIVDGTAATTDWPVVSFDFAASGVSTQRGWPDESDCAVPAGSGFSLTRNCAAVAASQRRFPFPLPALQRNEGGNCNDPDTCGDHHVLVVESGACRLWEGYSAYRIGGQGYAMSTAAWDLRSLALRPAGWTSGDAAGLPITPLLARAAEAAAGEVRHPLRVTFSDGVLANSFDWPARHAAGSATPGGIPFGALLRLKADFAIPDSWTPQARALATAMKRYGLYVADIGSAFYVQGEPSAAWDARAITQLQTLTMANMEFVNLGAVTGDARFSRDSMAAGW
jgi:hypothetical protein